jgi:hypothetical protein
MKSAVIITILVLVSI